MSTTLYLHLSTRRSNGGSFQYEMNALEAALSLASRGVPLVVGYEDPEWKGFIPDHITSIFIPRRRWVDLLFKGLTTLGTPLFLLQSLFRLVHPASRCISPSSSVGKFYPSQESQLTYLAPGPSLCVVHDLMHRYETSFPEAASTLRAHYRNRHFEHFAKVADGVCVESEMGRRQLVESYGISPEKTDVLPYAVPSYVLQEPPSDFESRYRLPPKFLFYPATMWQHKNHELILKAMGALLPQINDLQLVMVGGAGNAEARVKSLVNELGLNGHVQQMGYVDDRDMSGFYQRARALVMPTFFGPTNIPPLEAMYHGCPVLVSNNYGMPEQCGDACISFNPRDVTELAHAVARVWTNDDLAKCLGETGKARADHFSKARFLEGCEDALRRRLHLESAVR